MVTTSPNQSRSVFLFLPSTEMRPVRGRKSVVAGGSSCTSARCTFSMAVAARCCLNAASTAGGSMPSILICFFHSTEIGETRSLRCGVLWSYGCCLSIAIGHRDCGASPYVLSGSNGSAFSECPETPLFSEPKVSIRDLLAFLYVVSQLVDQYLQDLSDYYRNQGYGSKSCKSIFM